MQELNLAPSDETMDLYEAILNGKLDDDEIKVSEP
jgi:hypothetical protein